MADFDVDLAIIGGGSGGVRAARVAASYGAKVIVAEGDRVGGTCVIRGCVPKKLMVYASDFQKEIGNAAGFGWSIPSAKHDWEVLTGNIDREVARLEAAYTSAIEKSGARLVKERATFQDARTLRLSNGETVRARNILIATGSTPNHGEVLPGLEHVISSDKVFELRELPRRIIIQGGGYIAVEFACRFAGLGSKVTLVCRSDNILRGFDKDIRTHVRDALEQQEIRIVTG